MCVSVSVSVCGLVRSCLNQLDENVERGRVLVQKRSGRQSCRPYFWNASSGDAAPVGSTGSLVTFHHAPGCPVECVDVIISIYTHIYIM